MSNIKSAFANLNAKQKKTLAITGTVVGVVGVLWIVMGNPNNERSARTSPRPQVEAIITDEDPRGMGLDALASQMRQLQSSMTRLERKSEQSVDERGSRSDAAKIEAMQSEMQQLHSTLADMQEQLSKSQSGNDDTDNSQDGGSPEPINGGLFQNRAPLVPNAATDSAEAINSVYQNLPEPPPVDPTSRSSERVESPKIRTITGKPEEEADPEAEKVTITLPSGSILSGVLMTGMDAPTGNQAQRDPFPTLLRIKGEAILPNRFRADFRECFLIAAGWGDLSSERAYMRAERISCVRNDGTILESTLDAYATGEDGKAGVRGRLVSKQGQVIARSLMAGFMEGAAGAFDVRQVPSINITRGNEDGTAGSPVYEQAFNSNVLQGAAARGAGSAMERIADYYLAMAENIFPIIEIDAMREVDFIVKRGMTVTLSPENSLTQVSVD
ncbi:TraB/VirB10 family protein [Pseudomonas neustonica]|uniref:TraB/VirB10 family protein n=1 Tax=Pseudomonas neustonica TaxID=2487346 RepID=UPI003F45E8C3|tara:strand:- start:1723 stop:3051 length:1329 start_codon:yes stop_codon:yes gene_type:complete